jgi:hypothetical protein
MAPAAPRTRTSTNRDGASHPCRLVTSRVPSVGSSVCMNGMTKGAATAAATAKCWTVARPRRPLGWPSTEATTAISNGTAPDTLTSAPKASAAVAQSFRWANRATTAAATANPSSASLCPPATPWNTTTGFQPIRTAANAARSGSTRRAATITRRTVPRLATAARSLKVRTMPAGDSTTRVTPPAIALNAGP